MPMRGDLLPCETISQQPADAEIIGRLLENLPQFTKNIEN